MSAGFFTAVYNLFTAPVIRQVKYSGNYHKVSVLIPARNESANIEQCIRCVSVQTFPNIEILILDDYSEDDTYSKALKLSEQDGKVKIFKGKSAPSGWKGKSWACRQLSELSEGSYLLFIDADVRLNPAAVESALAEAVSSDTDLLSVFPEQIMKTFGEKITVQILNWLMLSFLPVKKVFSSRNTKFAAANGQFMFFKRTAYFESGGHELVSDKIVEDIELAKSFKSKNYMVKLMLSKGIASCRMYCNLKESIAGFTKNFYPGSSMTPFVFVLILMISLFTYLSPVLLIFADQKYLYLLSVMIIQSVIVSHLSSQNMIINIFLLPVQIIMMCYIGLRSLILFNSGKVYWKNRKL